MAASLFTPGPGGWPELAIGTHLAFVHDALYEGNWTPCMGVDSTHGINGWVTMFRNYARGTNTSYRATSEPIRGVNIGGFSREMYSIGNVLIDPAIHQASPLTAQIIDIAIEPAGGSITDGPVLRASYLVGWGPVLQGGNGAADDWDNGEAGRNFHRHLDWDAYSGAQYDNLSNPVKTLPNSLHRTSAPELFRRLHLAAD